ncbi:MAG: hypothetical protein IJP92_06815 [Lachnospiraceae bacterium]|nr:hypothetical protein [Lachnospiraceae bacterium]
MHKYIYSNHLSGGVFFSDEKIPEEYLFCDQCGDSNQEIGEAGTFFEAWQLIYAYGGLSLNGEGGFALDYLFPTIYNEFYPDRQIETDEHGCCNLSEEAIIRRLWEDLKHDRKAYAMIVKKNKRSAWAFMVANGATSEKEIFESYSEGRLLKELEGCVSDES